MTTNQTIDGVPRELLDAKPSVPSSRDPVTMDGKTTIREYVANSVPENQIGDDWTKGYEECKRRIHRMFQHPVNTEQPAPVAVKDYQNKINHLKQLLRNVRATLHFSPEDVLAIDAALREDEE